MATKVHMEALSPTMEEGQIVKWLKGEGDPVAAGDILAEVETDKATMELVARGDGILRAILKGEGEVAPVGEVIAVVAGEDEDIAQLVKEAGGGAEPANGEGGGEAAPNGKKEAESASPQAEATEGKEETTPKASHQGAPGSSQGTAPPGEEGGRLKASPVARRLAAEEGVELTAVQGSGPGGRIVKRDVEQAMEGGVTAPAAGVAPGSVSVEDGREYTDHPLSQMRKTIAKRLVESIGPVPHFFLTVEVDMSRMVEARPRVNAILEAEGVKISYNDIVLKAVAMALHRHPECNAHWRGDHIRQFRGAHVGVAVAVEDGLITPVIRNAHLKGLAAIATEVRELVGRARNKKLKPEEYTGATFSVSNLGMFGIQEFTAVINPPEAGILAVGAMQERPVVVDGDLEIRPMMRMTMSCDHRVIDGAQGSRFLQTLTAILEEPLAALA
ncbi:MAG: pyruvate dehydrogenase complex dihydrolipoamide acetyltransferase [Gemmatimonadota bacterium]